MANNPRKKKRKSSSRKRHAMPRKRRRRNPVLTANMRSRSSRRRKSKRGFRRNPAVASMLPSVSLFTDSAAAIGGGILTRAVPAMLLKEQNTGFPGYLANFATMLAASWGASKFINKRAGQMAFIGGGVMLTGRIVEDFIGQKVVEFGQLPGLSGDMKYDLSGQFVDYNFPVPTSSLPALPSAVLPAVAEPAPGVSGLGMQHARNWGSNWGNRSN